MKRRALPFLLGAVSGTLGGMMGVGGGIVLVPLLVHVLHEDQHQAQGTSLAIVLVTALVAAASYYTLDRLDLMVSVYLALGAVPGVILGSRIAAATPAAWLRAAFGVLLAITAIRLLAAPPHPLPGSGPWLPSVHVLLGLVVGTLAGLLGVGGGTILVPILVIGESID
ncbi:MAG: TSUP family transporter, partial [Candidatus Eiseniibacteriota bacterium]